MTAFRVFGTSFDQCLAETRKKTDKGPNEPLADWEQRTMVAAQKLYESRQSIKPVSNRFDAPQFCEDFINNAPRDRFKNLAIYYRKEEKGLNPRTGKPFYKWTPLEGAA